MAKEKEKDAKAADKDKDAKPKKSPVALLMIISVVIMILTPVITILAFQVLTRDMREAVETPVLEAVEVSLPRVQVNVAEANGTRYAQIDIVVEVSDEDLVPVLTEHDGDNPPSRLKRIQSIIIGITSEKTISALLSTDGKRKLALEIKDSINSYLADKESGMVTDVYFSGFLIQ